MVEYSILSTAVPATEVKVERSEYGSVGLVVLVGYDVGNAWWMGERWCTWNVDCSTFGFFDVCVIDANYRV